MTLNASAENGASGDGLARQLRLGLRVEALDRRHVERARQVVDDRVEQRLDALVLERGAEQHRRDRVGERRRAERAPDHLGRDERTRPSRYVSVSSSSYSAIASISWWWYSCACSASSAGISPIVHLRAEVVLVDDRVHLDEVDDAAVVLLLADRELDRHRVGAEAVAHRLDGGEEVRAGAVHLVDERDPRDLVLVGLAPDGLGLRLHAGDRVEDGDRAVEHAQAPLHLDRKVHVPGRIDDVDAMVAPGRGRRGRRDRDAALLLLRHPVHRRGALVDLAHLVGAARVVEDALRRRGLARVDVGHDPDVADAVERDAAVCGGTASCSPYQR